MALKIVGRTPRMQISERRERSSQAKGVTLHCDACDRDFGVIFPTNVTVLKRQQLMKAAADEHRRIGCTAGATEDARVFRLNYARD